MVVVEKEFDLKEIELYEKSKSQTSKEFNLNPVNNIYLILNKLSKRLNNDAAYVECGTFRGNTLLTAANFLKSKNIDKKLFGIDTFEGFPAKEHYYKDLPSYFEVLLNSKKITQDHYEKAKIRTNGFQEILHLENEYFSDTNSIFDKAEKFNNIKLLVGKFEDVTPNFSERIEVLHLDGDLYHSYITCLENLYGKVIAGGSIIFDEYYSLKYPGARVAVDEFLQDKKGIMEMYRTPEGFERWCFVKEDE